MASQLCFLRSNAMEVESSMYTDFISCDRAGRRNAVHDIHQDATTVSVRKLTEDLGDLAVEGAGELLQTPVRPAPSTQAGRARHEMAAQLSLGASNRCSRGTSHSLLHQCLHAWWETHWAEGLLRAHGMVPGFLAHEHCTLQPRSFAQLVCRGTDA